MNALKAREAKKRKSLDPTDFAVEKDPLLESPKGATLKEAEVKSILNTYIEITQKNISHESALLFIASTQRHGVTCIREVVNNYKEKKNLLIKETNNRGRGSAFIQDFKDVKQQHVSDLREKVNFWNKTEGSGVSVKKIIDWFREEKNLNITEEAMLNLLRYLGYVWDHSQKISKK